MRIAVLGCCGRMGRANLAAVIAAEDCDLAGGIARPDHALQGQDLGLLAGVDAIGIAVTSDAASLIASADVAIEFSSPEATLHHAGFCATHGCAHVIGTTGFAHHEELELKSRGEKVPIVFAANMSLGVNLLQAMVEQVASRTDDGFDIEISEIHHRRKVDAPSGTALALGHAAARGRKMELKKVATRAREGLVGPRQTGTIGFAVSRGGDIVGEHDVTFAGDGERIVLRHVATDRQIYAKGAIVAARWLAGRPPGMYSMTDVLDLRPN